VELLVKSRTDGKESQREHQRSAAHRQQAAESIGTQS